MYTIQRSALILIVFFLTSSTLTATVILTPHQASTHTVAVKPQQPMHYSIFTVKAAEPPHLSKKQEFPILALVPKPAKKHAMRTPKPLNILTPTPASAFVAPTSDNAKIEAVIAFAMSQLGKPYKWGAAGPGAYDCSGLVLTAFAKVGIKLPHFTGSMIAYGKAVSRTALQRGDIVFPSKGHVAIYLGNGKMIHAPQPGEVIKISSVYAFYAGRRLL